MSESADGSPSESEDIINVVIGTAGHIDHGKSLLVQRLTGIDPDRLQEEKKRGITIDLGFAPLVLAGGVRVGIIDVSTLGKLEVRGPDAGALLDKVYTHRFSNLHDGRIRYGLLVGENGSIMDDGTITRFADDHYFVTTTTGNVDAIEDWFNWWLAGTGMEVFVTNVTSSAVVFVATTLISIVSPTATSS